MPNDQDSKFLSVTIYDYLDFQISNNKLSIKTLSVKNGPYDPSPPLLIFKIYNSQQGNLITPTSISFKYDNLHKYLNSFQKVIYSDIHNHIKKLNSDNNYFKTFDCLTYKSKLKTTLLYKMEYGGAAISLSISLKDLTDGTGTTIFMGIKDYIAMVQLLKQYQNSNYLNYCFKFTEMHNRLESDATMEDIKNNLHQICGRIIAIQNHIENSLIDICHKDQKCGTNIDNHVDDEATLDLTFNGEEYESSSTEKTILHDDLNNFLSANVDKMDIGLNESNGDVFIHPEPQIVKLTNNNNSSLLNIINCDVKKFEQLLSNLSLEINPIRSFINLLNEKSASKLVYDDNGFSFLEIISSLDLKRGLNNHLQNQIKIPAVSPILINISSEISKDKTNLAIELLTFFSFYSYIVTQLKEKDFNTTNNKELIFFILKEISCPLIFSYIPLEMSKKIVRSLVKESYIKMVELHVFDQLIDDINTMYNIVFKITPVLIENKAEEIFTKITSNRSVLTLKRSLERLNKNKIVYFPTTSETITNYDTEQIKKIIVLNMNYLKFGKIDVKLIKDNYKFENFNDLPFNVIKFFKLENKKHNNANLKRYVSTEFKNDSRLDEYLRICEYVNCSYYDLKGVDVDFSSIPIKVLRAIVTWDVEVEPMIEKQYTYYKKLVQNSTIEDSMVLSMLKNIGTKTSSDFINSLLVATKELGV